MKNPEQVPNSITISDTEKASLQALLGENKEDGVGNIPVPEKHAPKQERFDGEENADVRSGGTHKDEQRDGDLEKIRVKLRKQLDRRSNEREIRLTQQAGVIEDMHAEYKNKKESQSANPRAQMRRLESEAVKKRLDALEEDERLKKEKKKWLKDSMLAENWLDVAKIALKDPFSLFRKKNKIESSETEESHEDDAEPKDAENKTDLADTSENLDDSEAVESSPELQVGNMVMWVSQGFDQWNEPREIKRIEVYPDSGEKYAFFEGSETGILCDQLEIPDSKTENKPDLANTSENPYNSKEAEESHVQSEIVHTSVFAERLQSHAQRAKILSDDGVLKDVASPNWKGYFLAAMISRLPKWVPLFDKEKNRRQAEVYKTLRSSQHRVSPLVSNRFFAMSRKDAIEAEIEGYNNGITEYKDSIARQIRDNTQISAPEKIEKMQRLDSLMETSKKQIESQYEAELIAIETIQDCYKKIPRWVGPLHYLIPPLLKKGQVYKHRLDAALLVLGDTSVSVISPYATDDDAKRSHEQVLLHYASLQRTKEKAIASALEKAQQEITELVS